jgi:1-acyl-sn-glycerol-3-phosphate acyltransferase
MASPKNVLGNDPFMQGAKPSLLLATPKEAGVSQKPEEIPTVKVEGNGAKSPDTQTLIDPAIEHRFATLEMRLQQGLRQIENKIQHQTHPPTVSPLPEFEKRFSKLAHNYEERLKEVAQQYQQEKEPTPEKENNYREQITQILFTAYQKLNEGISLEPLRNIFRQFWMRSRSEQVDEFGLDPIFEARMKPVFDFLYKTWWRVETSGVTNIPNEGRALLVGNHSGALPYDGAMIKVAVMNEHPEHREVRFLVENFVYYFPFGGSFMSRIGGARACQENAECLLRKDQVVAVFPEGVKGVGKLYSERYQLQRFGRGGFIKLALRTGSIIVPVAVIGAEEAMPLMARADWLGRWFKLPYIPITPTFPWLGLLGLIPYPTKWYIHMGKPFDFSAYGPEAIDDDILINQFSEMIRANIQQMVYDQLKRRRSVWLG